MVYMLRVEIIYIYIYTHGDSLYNSMGNFWSHISPPTCFFIHYPPPHYQSAHFQVHYLPWLGHCCVINNWTGLCSWSLGEDSKPLKFPKWYKCLCYSQVPWIPPEFMLMKWLLVDLWIASGWELVTRKTRYMWLESWDLEQAQPPGRGGRMKIEFNHVAHDSSNQAYVIKAE